MIINRKHFIKSTVEALIQNGAKPTRILNLGAGFSPLALELSTLLGDRTRFIEMDMKNMSHKQQVYSELVPDLGRFISCIKADIADTACLEETLHREMGEPAQTRLIVIMEGLSYYIGRPAMERVLESLSTLAPDLSIIFEHLKPCRLISEERRFIPHGIFSHVIRAILGPGFSLRYCDMDAMESGRTGSCRYFPTPDAGWLSCAVTERRPDTE